MKRPAVLFLLSMLLAFGTGTGCMTSHVVENTRVPEIVIDEQGKIFFNEKEVGLKKVASALKSEDVETDQEINILIPEKPDRALMRAISGELLKRGYSRTIFVKNRKATSSVSNKK